MKRINSARCGAAALAMWTLAACGAAGPALTGTDEDTVVATAFDEGAGKADSFWDKSVSDLFWCGRKDDGATRKWFMRGAKDLYMTTDKLDRKIKFTVDPSKGDPVVAIEASLKLRRCLNGTVSADGESYTCDEYGPWTFEPLKLKVGHGSVELDLRCLAMGLPDVYRDDQGRMQLKIRLEQGFDGPASLVTFAVESTCKLDESGAPPTDDCYAQPDSADPIQCDRQKVYEIDDAYSKKALRYSNFLLDQNISKAIYLASLAPWRETAAPTVQIQARLRTRPCVTSRPGEDFPVCLAYGQAIWRPIKAPVVGEQSVTLDMASLAMGLGTDEIYGEASNRFWMVTYSVSEPGSYRVNTSCPIGTW